MIRIVKSMKSTQNASRILWALGFLLISACTDIERQIATPGVAIERISTETTTIRSAFFAEYKQGVFLAGRVSAKLSSKRKISGHVHVGITAPDGKDILCTIAPHRNPWRQFHKPYRANLKQAPEPGSVVRVWQYNDTTHQDCHTFQKRKNDCVFTRFGKVRYVRVETTGFSILE